GLVRVLGLAGGDEHFAEAALALLDVRGVAHRGEDVAGADVVEVLDLGATVEDAGERPTGLRAGAAAAAPAKRRVAVAGVEHGGAEIAGRAGQAAIAGLLRLRLVVVNGVGVAHRAGEHADRELVHLAGPGL